LVTYYRTGVRLLMLALGKAYRFRPKNGKAAVGNVC